MSLRRRIAEKTNGAPVATTGRRAVNRTSTSSAPPLFRYAFEATLAASMVHRPSVPFVLNRDAVPARVYVWPEVDVPQPPAATAVRLKLSSPDTMLSVIGVPRRSSP